MRADFFFYTFRGRKFFASLWSAKLFFHSIERGELFLVGILLSPGNQMVRPSDPAKNSGSGGCKMEGGVGVAVAAPSPINPLKTALGLSAIHSMPGAQCRGPQTSRIPHPPTYLRMRTLCRFQFDQLPSPRAPRGFCTEMCAQPQGFCTTENALGPGQ